MIPTQTDKQAELGFMGKMMASPNSHFRKRLFKWLAIPAAVLVLLEPVMQIFRFMVIVWLPVSMPPVDVYSEGARYTLYALVFGPWVLYQAARTLSGSGEYNQTPPIEAEVPGPDMDNR